MDLFRANCLLRTIHTSGQAQVYITISWGGYSNQLGKTMVVPIFVSKVIEE